MNKFTKLLSVFIIAGALGTGVAGVAGCTNKGDDNGHKHNYTWVDDENGTTHHEHCGVDGCDAPDKAAENHTWSGDECDKCHAAKPTDGAVAPEGATGIITEWEGGLADITLNETEKTASIDISKVKVYYAIGSTKGAQVPVANYTVTVNKDGSPVTTLTGLKQGHYEILVELQNVKKSDGTAANWESFDEIDILNPIKADSLVKTSSDDTTCEQASDAAALYANWTYTVTYNNGDKLNLTNADVTVSGVDTVAPGTRNATVTYGNNNTLTVAYTVTANANIVTQSYAVNANVLELGSNTADKVLNAAGKISLTAKSGGAVDIDGNIRNIDGKSFVQRIKLGGSPISTGGVLNGTTIYRTIKLEDVNATTVQGATSRTLVTVYAASSSESTERKLAIYKEGGTAAAPSLTKVEVGESSNGEKTYLEHGFTTISKHVFEITDTGTFHIASTSGGLNIYYVQVDKIMNGETGAQNVPLGGENKAISLDLVTDTAKTVYKQTDTSVDTSAITGTVSFANEVTADSSSQAVANADLTFDTSKVDFTKLGEYPVTVTYGEGAAAVKKTYNVTVETAVDGVQDATAKFKTGVVAPVATADDKLTIKKSDIEVAPVWTKDALTGLTTTYAVKYNGVEIDDENGTQFAVGTYEIVIEITISDGTNQVTLNKTLELKVEVEGAVSAEIIKADDVAVGTSLRDNKIDGTKFSVGATTAGGDTKAVASTAGTVTAADGKTFTNGWLPGGSGRELTVTAKENITVKIYFTICNGDFGSASVTSAVEKGGDLQWTITPSGGTAGALQTDSTNSGNKSSITAYTVEISLNAGDVLTLTASSNRVVLFGVEAV